MDQKGLNLCSRYSYPPNFLSLCGPDKKTSLSWYSSNQKSDLGLEEILVEFSTLFPYLKLIAFENKISDPFCEKVVEAYWLGNSLLTNVTFRSFERLLNHPLKLNKKIAKEKHVTILKKIARFPFPHHSFHVLNIYKRTGNIHTNHDIYTMDACIINWGVIEKILPHSLIIKTKPIREIDGNLCFSSITKREILFQSKKDVLKLKLKIGDFVSYHWGMFCQKLSKSQVENLCFFTNLSLQFANSNL